MTRPMTDAGPHGGEILVVDDTPANLELLTRVLSLAGYEVRPAARPEVALASALDAPPDLAVLDVRMPGMDGFELCRRLKGDPRTAAVPVIFISAAHDEAVRLQGFDVGGVDFVSTPIEERLVLARVATHLRLARAQRDLEAERALLEQRVRERTARLQESETLARTLLNATFDLTHLLDADGTILDLNAAMADALGAPREALIGTCVFDRFTEHVAEHRKQLLRRTIEEQQPLRTVDVSQPGTVLDTAFYPVPAAAGQKRRVVVFSHDITERQRTEDALWERARSEERARAMFDQAAVGMAYVGPDGRFLRINRKFCDIVGYSECEMLERTFMDITHPEDVGMDGRALRRLVSGEIDTYGREKRYVCKDGTTIWAEVAVSLVRADSSTAPWLVTVVQDISARKRAEQAVLEYQRRLKELAAELSRTEQRERRNIAAELHDRVGQSLSAMRAELAAARKETSGPSVDARLEDVSNCLREAIRDTRNIMSSLSDPILDRLGLSAGISAWLREEIGARHGLDTRFSDDGEQKPLGPDASSLLFRCVCELVTNVVKHARASRVSVSLLRKDRNLEIVIEDDGVGMEADRLFGRTRGEGFGLFSVEERMADIGGALSITTAPGRGVRASLVAPLEI